MLDDAPEGSQVQWQIYGGETRTATKQKDGSWTYEQGGKTVTTQSSSIPFCNEIKYGGGTMGSAKASKETKAAQKEFYDYTEHLKRGAVSPKGGKTSHQK